jgi:DNA end-binding protein Ku
MLDIPVKVFCAVGELKDDLNTFHVACNTKLQKPYYCPSCNSLVNEEDTIRGVQTPTELITFSKEELSGAKPERSNIINITGFFESHKIDPIYFDKCYFIEPEVRTDSYSLLLHAMADSNLVGFGTACLSEAKSIIISPMNRGFRAYSLYSAAEVRECNDYDFPRPKDKELKAMKKHLKEMMTTFRPEFVENNSTRRVELIQARMPKIADVLKQMGALKVVSAAGAAKKGKK